MNSNALISIQGSIIKYWKKDLQNILDLYNKRPAPIYFIPMLFFFFIIVNVSCYWLAMYTAFPDLIFGPPRHYYFKVQFPVGILGACFDTASFFITIWIVKRAIKLQKIRQFYSHLSIDLVIAILATFWVLFVFTFSSWAIRYIEPSVFVYDISQRQEIYEQRVISAITEPGKNIRNIYFGLLMGISAMLPTLTHIFYAIRSSSRVIIGSKHENSLINSKY